MMRIWVGLTFALMLTACATADRPLRLVAGAGAVYPPEAKDARLEGYVEVQYDVSVDGRVTNARVVRAEPPGVFDESALRAIRSWQFEAPVSDGVRVAARNRVSTIRFQLEGSDRYEKFE